MPRQHHEARRASFALGSTTSKAKIKVKPIIYAAIAASVLAVHAFSFAEEVNGSNGAAAGSSSTATAGSSTGRPYAVFVDRPTGFTFVKLPSGWKFVGAVTHEDAAHLPPGVLTAVLPRNNEP
jgi:hypothetical protein